MQGLDHFTSRAIADGRWIPERKWPPTVAPHRQPLPVQEARPASFGLNSNLWNPGLVSTTWGPSV
jgi:hypothetical protein